MEVDNGGMNVKWRVEQSSNNRALVAGFTIGQANKEVRSSAFVVASKPSHLRKRRRKETSGEEEERLPKKVMRVLEIMQQTIMRLETRIIHLEDQQHAFDAISNFTFDEFTEDYVTTATIQVQDPAEPIHFELR